MKKAILTSGLFFITVTALTVAAALAADKKLVIVNGTQVSQQDLQAVARSFGTKILPGRYWYDKMSGLWGWEGQPTAGQILPGLPLGGLLKTKASNGKTGVFINGRELPMLEVTYLQTLGPVFQGRYWMNAQGIGGFEGGPPIFDLNAAARQRSGGGLYGGNSRTTPFGHVGSDGNCSYFFDPSSGSSVMSGNC